MASHLGDIMTIGIYRIFSVKTNQSYYGSSKWIERRFKEHKSKLRKNKHGNKNLLKVFHEYGFDNLQFEILKICSESELEKLEQKYLDSDKNKLNIWIFPFSPKGCKRPHHIPPSEETKKKIGETMKKNHAEQPDMRWKGNERRIKSLRQTMKRKREEKNVRL